ncbi:MAG: SIS domain-containing protein [Pseudomonadota bacterium]
MKSREKIYCFAARFFDRIRDFLLADVYLGRHPARVPDNSIVFFPIHGNLFCCGLVGIASYKNRKRTKSRVDTGLLNETIREMQKFTCDRCLRNDLPLDENYLGGNGNIGTLMKAVRDVKCNDPFYEIFTGKSLQKELSEIADRIDAIVSGQGAELSDRMGRLSARDVNTMSGCIEELKDVAWCIRVEILGNIKKIGGILGPGAASPSRHSLQIFKQINAVLNSIDRLEVRGRDSAGISLLFVLDKEEFEKFKEELRDRNLADLFNERSRQEVLVNKGIGIQQREDGPGRSRVSLAITHKVAAEVGSLGDNIICIRRQVKNDEILQTLVNFPHHYHTVLAHTRWASVGAITEANCHPVDNNAYGNPGEKIGIIHVCLNGDIDNFQELKKECELKGNFIHRDITTDTKIIPIQIENYLRLGHDIEEAFRLALNDFEGSHAISMHTDLAPGKLFLAQKGSGQTLFIGLAEDHYMPTSEVYGFVEETPSYLRMDGEKTVHGKAGMTQGQIFVLDQETGGGMDGIKAMYYDGTLIELGEKNTRRTEITSRDIDRQEFPHYFLKEISEAPASVEKTLQNRWKIKENDRRQYVITLDDSIFPEPLARALVENQIKRVFFVGQGTAGVAALACADILNHFMDDPSFHVSALKASELSGFKLDDFDGPNVMADTLVVAISQSGTTTDTNRTVDMVKQRGAHTLAIVNRRDSDITFKVDGVMYTSTGRDIEMSVASTKAFYSQIVAGAILSLHIAALKKQRDDAFISDEIERLLKLPSHMRSVLAMQEQIEASAKRLAVTKTYWAAVGSGPNKASADEIRIKLSELCYKTISSDFVEDKKHIDLSSEPLIIVCAAGTRASVIGDIVKDTAIFHAHKSTPVVIADKGENRFAPYAADVFHVPVVSEHLAPILNTLVGHIWGYHAALAINEGSRFIYDFRESIQDTINSYARQGLTVFELVLETSFREKIVRFYREFRRRKAENNFPIAMGLVAVSDLTLLLKYLAGKLPVPDFEIDFGKKGTAKNMLDTLFECVGEAINCMSRPVDAIKHQAKTVTVGTSRISESVEGILFDALTAHGIELSQILTKNIIVLRNLQGIVSRIEGAIYYRIGKLDIFGDPTDESTIEVIKKEGVLKPIPSRVETDTRLKGTKKIITRQKNVYIGKGRKDDRSIIIIPIIPASSATPNIIENMLLLNISFKENIPLHAKIKALGGKYEHIKSIVQENSVNWDDSHLELVETEELFGKSAEKIGEFIVPRVK